MGKGGRQTGKGILHNNNSNAHGNPTRRASAPTARFPVILDYEASDCAPGGDFESGDEQVGFVAVPGAESGHVRGCEGVCEEEEGFCCLGGGLLGRGMWCGGGVVCSENLGALKLCWRWGNSTYHAHGNGA